MGAARNARISNNEQRMRNVERATIPLFGIQCLLLLMPPSPKGALSNRAYFEKFIRKKKSTKTRHAQELPFRGWGRTQRSNIEQGTRNDERRIVTKLSLTFETQGTTKFDEC